MEKFKVRVNSLLDSNSAQELLASAGYRRKYNNFTLHNGWVCFDSDNNILCVCSSQAGKELDDYKEITLQELRDMVVLKRNNIGDANYVRPRDGKLYFKSHNNRYYYMLDDEWIMSTWENEQLEPQLTPIYKEQPMKEFLVKVDGKYELKLLDVCEHPDAVEVPDGANILTKSGNELYFWNTLKDETFVDGEGWKFCDDVNFVKLDDYAIQNDAAIIWKRKPKQETIDAMNGDDGEVVSVLSFGAIDDKKQKHSHYKKDVKKLNEVDVYRVLELFEVKSHAVGHAVKKLLCSGERGAKDYKQDIQEAIDSLQRHLEMLEEDEL